jgi:multimeric flavodoxin WrbA
MSSLLLVNGSLRGARGDTAAAFAHVTRRAVARGVEVDELVLADVDGAASAVIDRVKRADAMIVGTGAVWSSPSSVMMRFLEVLTPHELEFLGKSAGVVVSMDSTGGVECGSRLMMALNLMGFALPPCSLVVLARNGGDDDDVWSTKDLAVLVDNVLGPPYRGWPIRRASAIAGAYPAVRGFDLGLPRVVSAPKPEP